MMLCVPATDAIWVGTQVNVPVGHDRHYAGGKTDEGMGYSLLFSWTFSIRVRQIIVECAPQCSGWWNDAMTSPPAGLAQNLLSTTDNLEFCGNFGEATRERMRAVALEAVGQLELGEPTVESDECPGLGADGAAFFRFDFPIESPAVATPTLEENFNGAEPLTAVVYEVECVETYHDNFGIGDDDNFWTHKSTAEVTFKSLATQATIEGAALDMGLDPGQQGPRGKCFTGGRSMQGPATGTFLGGVPACGSMSFSYKYQDLIADLVGLQTGVHLQLGFLLGIPSLACPYQPPLVGVSISGAGNFGGII